MSEHIIDINHLIKSFGENSVINDLSLSVSKGEVVVLIGPSGCGKSTLLRCLNGLEPIQGGSVTPEDRNGLSELRLVSAYDGAE